MVVTFFEIFGAIGTTAGLLSFVSSTIDNLNKRKHDYDCCPAKWQRYRASLEVLDMRLKRWTSKFGDEGECRKLWGEDGYTKVLSMAQEIMNLNEKLERRLYLHPEVNEKRVATTHEEKDWRDLLTTRNPTRATKNPELFSKLCYAICQRSTMDDDITSLVKAVDELVNYTKLEPTAESIRNLKDRHDALFSSQQAEWLQSLSNYMQTLYQYLKQSRPETSWSLVLSLPDDDSQPECIREDAHLLIHFDIEKHGIIPIRWNRREQMLVAELVRDAESFIMDVKHVEQRSEAVRDMLSEHSTSTFRRQLFEQSAALAWSIINWTILLWNTPWTDTLCSCGIRFAIMGDSDKPTFTTHGRHRNHLNCSGRRCKTRKLQLLGIVLAELALKKPLNLIEDDKSIGKYSYGSNADNDGMELYELWREVKRTTSSVEYRDALQKCFQCDELFRTASFEPKDVFFLEKEVLERQVLCTTVPSFERTTNCTKGSSTITTKLKQRWRKTGCLRMSMQSIPSHGCCRNPCYSCL